MPRHRLPVSGSNFSIAPGDWTLLFAIDRDCEKWVISEMYALKPSSSEVLYATVVFALSLRTNDHALPTCQSNRNCQFSRDLPAATTVTPLEPKCWSDSKTL